MKQYKKNKLKQTRKTYIYVASNNIDIERFIKYNTMLLAYLKHKCIRNRSPRENQRRLNIGYIVLHRLHFYIKSIAVDMNRFSLVLCIEQSQLQIWQTPFNSLKQRIRV